MEFGMNVRGQGTVYSIASVARVSKPQIVLFMLLASIITSSYELNRTKYHHFVLKISNQISCESFKDYLG